MHKFNVVEGLMSLSKFLVMSGRLFVIICVFLSLVILCLFVTFFKCLINNNWNCKHIVVLLRLLCFNICAVLRHIRIPYSFLFVTFGLFVFIAIFHNGFEFCGITFNWIAVNRFLHCQLGSRRIIYTTFIQTELGRWLCFQHLCL